MRLVGAIAITAVLLTGCAAEPEVANEVQQETADEAPEVAENSVFELELGTCLDDASVPEGADLADIPQVPCDEPHDSELFGIITIDDDSSGWVTCCSMSSTFSTSRTSFVCTIEALTRVW